MDKLRETVFQTLFQAGSIRYVDMHIGPDGRALLIYQTIQGVSGHIHTKAGDVKHYKPETALRFLRSVGLVAVKVHMENWHPTSGQGQLL